jgi:cellulose biosynthesis protein BcsQ
MSEAAGKNGKIITFYSYKGGTGRSMALANVAWILASQARQVLLIDWDLEAPGLHRYFHPFLIDPDLTSTAGLIDFVWDFALESVTPAEAGPGTSGPDRLAAAADLAPYTVGLDYDFGEGCLDFIPAGRQGPAYSSRVNSFNWENFYGRLGGGILLEEVRKRLKKEYDYVLIDSRTGVSDTSGICTVQLPDQLVVCFTCNNQSITGCAAIVESVLEQREKAGRKDGERLQVFPVLMRVDLAEKDKLDASRSLCRKTFAGFPNHLEGRRREQYWRRSEVLYHSYYAYEEILATFGDSAESDKTLLSDMERLTGHLTNEEISELAPIPEPHRLEVRARYQRAQDAPVAEAPDLKEPRAIELYERVKAAKEEWEQSERSPAKILPEQLAKELSYAHSVREDLLKREGYPEFLEQSAAARSYRTAVRISVGAILALAALALAFFSTSMILGALYFSRDVEPPNAAVGSIFLGSFITMTFGAVFSFRHLFSAGGIGDRLIRFLVDDRSRKALSKAA